MSSSFLPAITFVIGGARSGKSAYAEGLVLGSGLQPVYLATGQAFDDEMRARIAVHRGRRDTSWRTVEAPVELAQAVRANAGPASAVLVDCLTLWLTNLMLAEANIGAATAALMATLSEAAGPVVLVSTEVGLGVVPVNAMARDFVDHAGLLHQRLASIADRVVLVTAGLPLELKHRAPA